MMAMPAPAGRGDDRALIVPADLPERLILPNRIRCRGER